MRSFVINMDHQVERLAGFQQRNAWLSAERFPAFDGRRCAEPAFLTPPNRGAAASHIELWHRVAESDQVALIAEDDALILEADYASELGADDTLLALGFNWDAPIAITYGLAPAVIHHDQEHLRRILAGDGIGPTTERLLSWPLLHMFGTLAYIVTPRGARELLASLPIADGYINMPTLGYSTRNIGIDCHMNLSYERIGARVLFPPRAFSPNWKDGR